MNIRWIQCAVMVAMALPGGAYADESSAVAALRKLNATIDRDEKQPGNPVVRVILMGPQVTDAGLKDLKELKNLQVLFLAGSPVTDTGLKGLKELKGLRMLTLWGSQV